MEKLLRTALIAALVAVSLSLAGGLSAEQAPVSAKVAFTSSGSVQNAILATREASPPHGSMPKTLPAEWVVLGLGDSVTAASSCDCMSFIDLYAQKLGSQTRLKSSAQNLGVPGQTSSELLSTLLSSDSVQSAIAKANVVVVTIGANDFNEDLYSASGCPALNCYSEHLTSLAQNLQAINAQISKLRNGLDTLIFETGYWEIWKDGDVARGIGPEYVSVGDSMTKLVNGVIEKASASSGANFVDLYSIFRGTNGTVDDTSLLESDGDHPNAAGHALIAQTLSQIEPSF